MEGDEKTTGRSKRQRIDKKGRLAALDRLKQLKGAKNKYEVTEEAPVYEELSEKEFSRLVQERQDDDWIIDDDGAGYVEDGREIFDDDLGEEDIHTAKKSSHSSKKKFLPPNQRKQESSTSNIKSMFKTLPIKRKNVDVKLDDDDILGSIVEEVQNKSPLVKSVPQPTVLRKKPKKNIVPAPHVSPVCHAPHQRNPFAIDSQPQKQVVLKPRVVDFDAIQERCEVSSSSPLDADKNDAVDSALSSFDCTPDIEELEQNHNGSEQLFESNSLSDDIMELDSMSCELFPSETNGWETKVDATQPSKNSADNEFKTHFLGQTMDVQSSTVDVKIDSSQLPLTKSDDGKEVLRFFWLDAYEDAYKQPGVVYLFGKVYLKELDVFVSCCIIVRDIMRRIFILPREMRHNMTTKNDTGVPITLQDVYNEIDSIADKMKITEFRSKKSVKNYAFENADIPDSCEYLEVQYSAKFPAFPADLRGSTFSHVLGTDTTSLEILLLEQKIKGPCWLDIYCPQPSNPPFSWCKVEASVNNIQQVVPCNTCSIVPPLTVLSLHLTTVVSSKTQQNEIVAISWLSHNAFPLDSAAPKPHYNAHFCALTKPSDCIFPYDLKNILSQKNYLKIECFDGERALLAFFLAKLHKTDPDVIVGHDVVGFDLDVLLHRIAHHKIPHWSRLGRLKRAGIPRFGNSQGFSERNSACGRLICDVKISAKELLRCRSYDLSELSNQILSKKFEEILSEKVRDCYTSSPKLLMLVDNALSCADVIMLINCELNILPLALQITNIAGCVMSRTLLGGRSERNEYLLLHAFHEKNYIYPPKVQGKKFSKPSADNQEVSDDSKKGRRKPAYEGGLVLDPKIGFYDKYILLMDFNSLYPSIIQEYNICFTTLDRSIKETNSELDIEAVLPDPSSEQGILPTEIRKLVESRKQVKTMMKASDLPKDRLVQYDIRQRALKLTANSMYGCLGFSHSRFYAKALAALVTRKGREILMQTKGLVEKMGLEVIYGDTDSIMINTNQLDYDSVFQLGNKVKAEINKLFRLLEIDIDGVYKPMLLLKKKKYAAVAVSRLSDGSLSLKQEIKGLDVVRRDWSQLAKEAGEFVIEEILSDKSKEEVLENIHSYLTKLGEDVRAMKKPLSSFAIMKQLMKNPEDYPDQKNLSHVLVALHMNAKGGKKLRQNDTVPYIICNDGSNLPVSQRAYHPEEVANNSNLSIDVEYYLASQVHPVVSRLCNPIEGTDAAMIASLLGLNPSKYAITSRDDERYDDKLLAASSVFDDEDRFKLCDKLCLHCPNEQCNQEILIDGIFVKESSCVLQLSSCPACKTSLHEHLSALTNQTQRLVRNYIAKYYRHILECEDPGCSYTTRKIPLVFTNGGPLCPGCKTSNLKMQYKEEELYNQIAYFYHLFDLEKAKKTIKLEGKILNETDEKPMYDCLKNTISHFLHSSSFGVVDLPQLFQGLFLRPAVQSSTS